MTQRPGIVTVALVLAMLPAATDNASGQDRIVRKINANLVEVIVTGQGTTKEDALDDAYRKAVQTGAGTYIHSQTETQDFAIVRDTILTRATGFLQDKRILSATQADGVWAVQIKAVVSIRGVVDTWGAVTNLLKQRGRPKVMVVIKETVNGTTREESHLRAQIENRLKQAGFRLVNQSQISAINQKKLQTAIAEDKPDVVAAMAKQFGAQIFVMGTAQSTGRAVNVGGIAAWRYAAVGVVRTFRSDTGELLSSRTQRRSDLERSALAAAQKALENLGTVTAPLIVRDVLRFWQDAIEGRGEIQLEVTKLEKFSNYVKVKKAVAAIDGVKAINGNYHNGVAKFTIDSDVIAEKLAERIVETLEEKLEVEDVSANTITATFKKP